MWTVKLNRSTLPEIGECVELHLINQFKAVSKNLNRSTLPEIGECVELHLINQFKAVSKKFKRFLGPRIFLEKIPENYKIYEDFLNFPE